MKSAGVPDKNIYLSLERRMHCGVGVCQHCAVGSFYTCKDGPVFKYADIKNIPGAI
jgi:NAD(P)H-flavin reductase